MDKKVITVDCDGVIMENLWGRNWANQTRRTTEDSWYKISYLLWANINHWWRRPMPRIRAALENLKDDGYSLVMVTSRKEFVRPLTMRWLKKWSLDKYFDEFYFNNFGVTAVESKVKNIEKIGPVAHVDDNEETVKKLNLEFKNLRIYWLNPSPAKAGAPLDGEAKKNVIEVNDWREIVKK